jgi:hypothetical protein
LLTNQISATFTKLMPLHLFRDAAALAAKTAAKAAKSAEGGEKK